jgi:hypothetical protein
VKRYPSGGRARELNNSPGRSGFTATGFTDDPKCLTASNIKTEVRYRVDHLVASGRELHNKLFDPQDDVVAIA